MKILLLHSDFIEWEPKKRAIKDAEDVEKKVYRSEECLVVFSAVERSDEGNEGKVVKKVVKEIERVFADVKAREIVIYPYVHLTPEPSNPKTALSVLKEIEEKLKNEGYVVKRAPFGWYKAFNIKCKGHPLAELSRSIDAHAEVAWEEVEAQKGDEDGVMEDLFIILPSGDIKRREELTENEKDVEIAIKAELKELREPRAGKPPHVDLMKRLEIADHERISDAGNLRYYPKGALIVELLRMLGWKMAVEDLGAMPVRTPFMINPEEPSVKTMMGKFPERLYRVLPGQRVKKQEFRLRPACDYGVWSMWRDANISYKNLPMGIYEFDVIWRYEQRGELLGMYRLRNALMPDLHEMCSSVEQAFERFEEHMKKFSVALCNYIGLRPGVIVLNCKRDFYEKHKDVFIGWAKNMSMPIIVKLFSVMKTYKVAWIDVVAFDNLKRPMELSTVQLDTESAEWWGIKYMDKDNTMKKPVFLHTGFGIERTIAALIESAYAVSEEGKHPTLPLWLSPVQVRVIPVSDKFVEDALKLAKRMERKNIRVDVDDRNESVQKRIRHAELEWVPLIVVLGEKEIKSKTLPVRFRETGEVKKMGEEELVNHVKEQTNGMPFVRLPLPLLLSKRASFVSAI